MTGLMKWYYEGGQDTMVVHWTVDQQVERLNLYLGCFKEIISSYSVPSWYSHTELSHGPKYSSTQLKWYYVAYRKYIVLSEYSC